MFFRRLWCVALGVFLTLCTYAQTGPLLRTSYTPGRTRGAVSWFLRDITSQTGVLISYSEDLLQGRRSIRLNGNEHTVGDVLATLFRDTRVSVIERDGKILLIPPVADNAPVAQPIVLSGFVKDSASREVIVGATVYVPELQAGTTTNAYGYYSLTVPPGNYAVITAAFGYRPDTLEGAGSRDSRRDVVLPYGLTLSTVVVSSRKEQPADRVRLTGKDLAGHAGLLGENDVLRALQHVAGVQTGMEGSSSMIVRGGDPGQNLNILDGVPLYYVDHFYGITSLFNTDAVKTVDFYKGAFPSRYGGRLSSVVDVVSRDGNMERISGQASLGLLKGSLTLEGPIVKDKASVMVSARRTWIDALWRPFTKELGIDFYDITAKTNWIIDRDNRVYAAFYTGRDQIRFPQSGVVLEKGGVAADPGSSQARWGNTVGAARWTRVVSPRLFVTTTGTYSLFRYETVEEPGRVDSTIPAEKYTGRSTISDYSLRLQADYNAAAEHKVQYGLQVSNAAFSPASVQYETVPAPISAARFRSTELTMYGEDDWKLRPDLSLRGGLHAAAWLSADYQYLSLQPRLYATWRPQAGQTLYASATSMAQFLHLLSSTTSTFGADFWIPSTSTLAPERSWLFSAGYSRRLGNSLTLTAEAYYKDLRHVVTYRNATTIFQESENWEEQLTQGRGYSYGAEFSASARSGPWTLNAVYTLSRSWRQFAALNSGNPFPYRYDRRHNLHTELSYQRNRKFNAIAAWTFMSGEAITLPDQFYPDFDNGLPGQPVASSRLTYNYGPRNNYRLPPIHRLDVAFNFTRRRGKYFERTWTIGVFNAYARSNVMLVQIRQQPQTGQVELEGLSFLQFVPTITYSVRF